MSGCRPRRTNYLIDDAHASPARGGLFTEKFNLFKVFGYLRCARTAVRVLSQLTLSCRALQENDSCKHTPRSQHTSRVVHSARCACDPDTLATMRPRPAYPTSLPAPSPPHYKRMSRIGASSTLGAEVDPLLLQGFTRNVACHTPRPKRSLCRRTHTAARPNHAGAWGEARGARLGRAGVPATLIAAMVDSNPTKTKASLLSAPLI